jgi:hypothetical protein
MLFHHDGRAYGEAASEAAKYARTKYEDIITKGKTEMVRLLDSVDSLVPDDMIIKANALNFQPNAQKGLVIDVEGDEFTVHQHALGHMGYRSGIKSLAPVLRDLLDSRTEEGLVVGWKAELAARALNDAYKHQGEKVKYLSRSIKKDIRGFLSDRYRRYDVRPILGSFIEGIQPFGCVPLDGFSTDTKVSVRVVLPYILEPVDGEVMLYGLEFRNSDFGDGKLLVRVFVYRLWCTNLASLMDELQKVHLGSKLPDNLEFSQQTYELDTKTMASAMSDIVGKVLAPERVQATMKMIATANEEAKDYNDFGRILKGLTKGETDKVRDAFENGEDVTYLPKGKSTWRMSNTLSWLATQTENRDRRMELEALAGGLLDKVKVAA